ncbi:MAG TPA: hypothetical protein VJ963_11300 [Bacteroidales bacterium]|nr:hypothetical protein [Bacteroidales bacterium]
MKTKSAFSLMVFLFMTISFASHAQRSDFSGEWKLDREKTIIPDNQLFLSGITIKVKGDTLITTRVYENGFGEEYPFNENITLNNSDCNIVIYDMPRTSKAFFAESDSILNVESKTTFNGENGEEDLVAKELWKLDPLTGMLTMEFTNTISGTDIKGINYYKKSEPQSE